MKTEAALTRKKSQNQKSKIKNNQKATQGALFLLPSHQKTTKPPAKIKFDFATAQEIKHKKGERTMPQGGYRANAGRHKKSATQKKLEGNPGKRPIEVLDLSSADEIPAEPPAWLSDKAKEIYTFVRAWLEKIGCLRGILPCHLDEYSHLKANWHKAEEQITATGMIFKEDGKVKPSPFVALAQGYMKQANDAWAKIYAVVRETKLKDWDSANPNDDVMERLLGGR